MIENEYQKSRSLEILSISEVSDIIGVKNQRTTRTWLKKMGIQVHLFVKKSFVYRIDLDFALDQPYAMDLKRKYPTKWKEMYKCVAKDEKVYNLMVLELDQMTGFSPTTKVSLKNPSDKKLLNSLIK